MTPHPSDALSGLNILVVEDEMFIAMMVDDLLTRLGCRVVGPVSSVAEALRLAASQRLDAAVLDVNLGSEMVYPVANALTAAAVPYIFVTGYGPEGLESAHRHQPMIQKPFDLERFGDDLANRLSGAYQ